MLQSKVEVPWGIVYEVTEIYLEVSQLDFRLMHTYRENNRSVAFLPIMLVQIYIGRNFTALVNCLMN